MPEQRKPGSVFRFCWRRGVSRWYLRSIPADTLEDALAQFERHLFGKLGIEPAAFSVDHYVIEFANVPMGQQRALHSLRTQPRRIQVVYRNKAWPPGSTIPAD